MQPSRCLDEDPLVFQASSSCDQMLNLDMNQETFSPSLYDLVPSANIPALIPASSATTSAAVSIPKTSMSSYCDNLDSLRNDPLDFELMIVTSDLGLDDPLSSFGYGSSYENTLDCASSGSMKNVLSIVKGNMIREPTLAQLNANELDEPFLDNIDFDDLLSDKDSMIPLGEFDTSKIRSWKQEEGNSLPASSAVGPYLSPDILSPSISMVNQMSNNFQEDGKRKEVMDVKLTDSVPIVSKKQNTLHELLTQYKTASEAKVQPLVNCDLSLPSNPQLSSSAPAQQSLDVWKTESQQRNVSKSADIAKESVSNVASTSSLSLNELCSPKEEYVSNDEGFDSEPEDSDNYDEMSSDAESTISDDYDKKHFQGLTSPSAKAGKKERFFWQYNVQAKGPKINRLSLSPCTTDPHTLNEITDPVFSPTCSVQGIKHSGKARRGDGNDLSPNPRKLYQIGLELGKLNKVINDLTPVSELPFNARPRSRKEKNKLASRACRLKKKAQHEANKLKLYGLEHEHRKLLNVLKESRQLVVQYINENAASNAKANEKLSTELDKVITSPTEVNKTFFKYDDTPSMFCTSDYDVTRLAETEIKVAGHTADFVNTVIDSIAAGKLATPLECL